MNHFHAIDPQGEAHTRSSKGRTYTHTVVIMLGQAYADRKLAEKLAEQLKCSPRDYAFYQSMADGTWYTANPGRYQPTPDLLALEMAKYTARLAGQTVEEFTIAEQERVRAHHAKLIAEGYYHSYSNAGWCSRLDLAQKLAASGGAGGFKYPESVRILEAQVGKAPKAMKKAA